MGSTSTTCSTRPEPTCCADWSDMPRRRRHTIARSRLRPARSSASFSAAGSLRCVEPSHTDVMTDVSPDMRLYDYAASCNCYKVRLLLAQLGIAYERGPVDIFAGETLPDEYLAINPARTTPVLETGGRYLTESNAILLFLAHGTRYLPSDPFEVPQVAGWLIYEQTDVVPTIGGLRFRLLTQRLVGSDRDAVRRRNGALEVLRTLDEHPTTTAFFVGDDYT